MIPKCGHTRDAEAPRRCSLVRVKVESVVCQCCSHNPDSANYRTPIIDPAVRAAVARQLSGCNGCGDSQPDGT